MNNSHKPQTWLVTGAAGFIGSHIIQELLRNHRVIGFDNLSTGKHSNLSEVKQIVGAEAWERFTFIEGDIRNPADVNRAFKHKPDYVLHQAAIGSVPKSLVDPVTTHEVNVTGFLNILQASKASQVKRVVYASSSAVYGDCISQPAEVSKIGNTLSPYGLSKRANELYAEIQYRCFGLSSTGLRYFNVCGSRQDPNGDYAAVIPKWIDAMRKNERIYINGDGHTSRDFCPVQNIVQANIKAARLTTPGSFIFNVALGNATSLNQLFALLKQYTGYKQDPIYREFRSGDVKFSQADISQTQKIIDYQPSKTFEQGLKETVEWYLSQPA